MSEVIDANFLAGFSNVMRLAFDATKLGLSLKNVSNELQEMIADRDRYIEAQEGILAGKDRLLETNNILTKELRHRVRNNLQLIVSMLSNQLKATTDPSAIEGFSKIERRVMTLVEIYEQLLGSSLGRTINFGGYLSSLCSRFSNLHIASHPNVKLAYQTVPVSLGIDEVTALGLVITELVTNSYSHAFSDGTGKISVSLSVDHLGGNGTIILVDDGAGFADAGESKRHGVGLVRRLMEQIGGSATLRSDQGSEWTLTFPVPTIATER
jgi:two-component sensor histidine kinase